MHPVFHVSLLEGWHQRDGESQTPETDLPELEEEQEWEVEDIVAHQDYDGRQHYLVKWEGRPVEYNT